jgi:hypothetical protein
MRRFALGLLLAATLAAAFIPTAAAQTDARCFAETGQCITGRIRAFWEANGGLSVFGLPIGPQEALTIEGQTVQAQWFERNRLELHPENAAPYDVLIGRLGVDRLAQQGRDWFAFPQGGALADCRFFPETGQSVCGAILRTWRASGLEIDGRPGYTDAESLALFGLPISPLISEAIGGADYQVQWFERARFELHPANQPPFDVLLGLLGSEIRSAPAAAPPSAAPNPCQTLAPATNGTLSATCLFGGEAFDATGTGLTPKETVGVYLTAPNQEIVPLPIIAGDAAASTQGTYRLRAALPALSAPGIYVLTLEGSRSGVRALLPFQILPPDPQRPVADASLLPESSNVTPAPLSGRRGTTFSFVTRGFTPGERVGVYVTWPDGTVIGAPFDVPTDGAGNAGNDLTFLTDETDPVGIFIVTFEGKESKLKAYAYFRVLP